MRGTCDKERNQRYGRNGGKTGWGVLLFRSVEGRGYPKCLNNLVKNCHNNIFLSTLSLPLGKRSKNCNFPLSWPVMF